MKIARLLPMVLLLSLVTPGIAMPQNVSLVPLPAKLLVPNAENLTRLNPSDAGPVDDSWAQHLTIFNFHLRRLTGHSNGIALSANNEAKLVVACDRSLAPEAYRLQISDKEIRLSASTLKGLSHGTATLLQLVGDPTFDVLPPMVIDDQPRLTYRNFMIDMGRNPHSLALLKETIDLLWFYKVDSLQLHLTDDQRFAFPSTAFPKLWDGKLTLKQFKDLEAYAVARGVTIIPELEVPGHSTLLRQHYPEVFGQSPADLTKEPALQGIKTLLDELMEVFSSTPYIHVGGDEAFGVPDKDQRALINSLHAYLQEKGRKTIVWEGPRPGEGDDRVSNEIIHINWETIYYPPDQMLRDGYPVVNAAWDPLYIVDHYPRINFTMTSPQHIYETMTVTRFKTVNPGFPTFSHPIEVPMSEQLLGFCMPWWEGREENFFPMIVPRVIPFAEVAWNPEIKRDYPAFAIRMAKSEATRRKAFSPVAISATQLAVPDDGVFHHNTEVTLRTDLEIVDAETPVSIRYTLDGSQPNSGSQLYTAPILLTESTIVRATAFAGDQALGHGSRVKLTAVQPVDNLALGKTVTSSVSSGPPFSVQRITDGGTDNLDFYLAYPAHPKPVVLTIDLEKIQRISRVIVNSYSISDSYETYTVELSSDGKSYKQVASRMEKPDSPPTPTEHRFAPHDTRYIRIISHGNKGYVFDSFSKIVEVQAFAK